MDIKDFNLESFVKSSLRRAYRRTPNYYNTLNDSKRERVVVNKDGTRCKGKRWEHLCAGCKDWFPQKDINIDHIEPIGLKLDLLEWIQALFFGAVQKLCKDCHREKTKLDNKKIKEMKYELGIKTRPKSRSRSDRPNKTSTNKKRKTS